MLRIVVQKKKRDEWIDTDIAYDINRIRDIVSARFYESLPRSEIKGMFGKTKGIQSQWNIDEVKGAIDNAFEFMIDELKKETVSIV